MNKVFLNGLAAAVLVSIGFSSTVAVAGDCKPVKFKRGEYYATVGGTTAEGKVDCYTVKTDANQTMTVDLIGDSNDIGNTAITIPGIGDTRDSFQFKTQKKTYQVKVFQIKVDAKKPYRLNINVH